MNVMHRAAISRVLKRLASTEINQVKRGNIIFANKRLARVLESIHRTQARGGGHYNLELLDFQNQRTTERFNSGAFVEVVELKTTQYMFLYMDEQVHLMDSEFNQHSFKTSLLQNADKLAAFLQPEMAIWVEYHDQEPVVIRTLETCVLVVVDTNQLMADSAKGTSFKKAVLEHGVEVDVPEFIKQGDSVTVNLVSLKYTGRN